MRRGKMMTMMGFITLIMVMVAPLAVMAETITIEGEINDTGQVVSNGQFYEIADDDLGIELIESFIGERVKVTGTVTQDEDVKIITVTEFELLEG